MNTTTRVILFYLASATSLAQAHASAPPHKPVEAPAVVALQGKAAGQQLAARQEPQSQPETKPPSHPNSVRAADERFPLWGNLTPGRYAVGYKVLYKFDGSRTWTATRRYGKEFSPDRNGRPMRISVWYPATKQSFKTMHFGDYFLGATPPQGFEDVEAELQSREVGLFKPWLSQNYPALLSTQVNASLNAPAAAGRFPVVLTTGGQNPPLHTNVVLAEYLASQGYVVVTVFNMGPSSDQPDLALSPRDVAIMVRDFEFAYSVVRSLPNAEATRLAIIGHSIGGSAAILFAMQNANVSAVVGLDGTYGFPNPPMNPGIRSVTEGLNFAPQQMQAALLDLRRPPDDCSYQLDFSAVNAFSHSDRYLVTLDKMGHSSFNTEGAIAQFYLKKGPQGPHGRTNRTGSEGFYWSCAVIEAFLDRKLKEDSGGLVRMQEAVSKNERATMVHKPALPVRPSPSELLDLVDQRGFDAIVRMVEQFRRESPEEPIVNEAVFNQLGYYLLGRGKPARAVVAFRLVTHFHPASANAADSLGDCYLAGDQKDLARQAFELAIKLAPADRALSADEKALLIADVTKKLRGLRQ